MNLSKIDEISQHFPFIKLDEMVVMPNHTHGVLWIVDLLGCNSGARLDVETQLITSLPCLIIIGNKQQRQ